MAHMIWASSRFWPGTTGSKRTDFHAEWERRVFALVLAAGRPGQWNLDMARFARENRPPTDYLAKSYYEIWLAGLEAMLAERGLVSVDEMEVGRPLSEPKRLTASCSTAAWKRYFLAAGQPNAGE